MSSVVKLSAIIFLAVIGKDVVAQSPRWTEFRDLTEREVPEAVWQSFYGFTVVEDTTVVKDRFRYPISEPPLFSGDIIVKVKGRTVTDKESLLTALNSESKGPILVEVERKTLEGPASTINVKLFRGREELIRKSVLTKSQVPFSYGQLSSVSTHSFGMLPKTQAVLTGFCDELQDAEGGRLPVFRATPVAPRDPSQKSMAEWRATVRLYKSLGPFVLMDKRTDETRKIAQYAFYGGIIRSEVPQNRWRKGDLTIIDSAGVLVEGKLRTKVDGIETEVSVLTLFCPGRDNLEAPSSSDEINSNR